MGYPRNNQRRIASGKKKKRREKRRERLERDRRVTEEHGLEAHRMCGRKYRYRTEDEATMYAIRSQLFGAPNLRVYQCPYCDGWHLTSKPR